MFTNERQGLFTINEVARIIGINNQTIHYHLKRGRLPRPTYRLGLRRFFREEEVKVIARFFEELLATK